MNPLSLFPHVINEISSALDSGSYDDLSTDETLAHIEAGDLFDWLVGQSRNAGDFDFSLLDAQARMFLIDKLQDLQGGYNDGQRKWGVKNRGLCLLISWLTTLSEIEYKKLIRAALAQAGTVSVPYELEGGAVREPMIVAEIDKEGNVISYGLN